MLANNFPNKNSNFFLIFVVFVFLSILILKFNINECRTNNKTNWENSFFSILIFFFQRDKFDNLHLNYGKSNLFWEIWFPWKWYIIALINFKFLIFEERLFLCMCVCVFIWNNQKHGKNHLFCQFFLEEDTYLHRNLRDDETKKTWRLFFVIYDIILANIYLFSCLVSSNKNVLLN